MASLPDEAVIVDHRAFESSVKQLKSYVLEDTVFIASSLGIPGLLDSRHWSDDERWPRGRASTSLTLGGAVIEAVSASWKVPIERVVAANSLDKWVDVVIGREGDREIREDAIRIVRPKAEGT